jgi:hypothetical protein
MDNLTIIALFCAGASIFSCILVVSASILSAKISQSEEQCNYQSDYCEESPSIQPIGDESAQPS